MSNGIDPSGDHDGDLRDPALRRALDNAPDRDATPDPRTRDAIRKMANNLAAASVSIPASAANNASAAPWWRRLFGGGDTHARMPWNAAFATVLVAIFVTVLWHREPIPDARLDGEAKVAGAPAPSPAAAPTSPPAASTPQAPSPAIAAQQAPAAEASAAPARDAAREAPDRATADVARGSTPTPEPVRKQAAPAPETKAAPPEPLPPPAPAAVQAPAAPLPPSPATVAAAPPPAPAPEAPGNAESSARTRQKSESVQDERVQERRSTYAAAPAPSVAPGPVAESERSAPAIAAAPVAPAAPAAAAAPLRREPAGSASGAVALGGSPNADVSGAVRDTAPPRAAAARAAGSSTGASAFSALDRWTSFDITRAGLGVRHARGDIEGLAALVNTVARSATTADAQLAAPVEARLSLYQGGSLIAVLEIAGDQVRWTPQPGGTATIGTPPAQALAALRALLTR